MAEKSWIDNPQFKEFKEGLGYAKSRTMWFMAKLNELTDEQAYWCWHMIQHGIEYNRRQNGEDKD